MEVLLSLPWTHSRMEYSIRTFFSQILEVQFKKSLMSKSKIHAMSARNEIREEREGILKCEWWKRKLKKPKYSRVCKNIPHHKIFSSCKIRKLAGPNLLYPLELMQHWINSHNALNCSMQNIWGPKLFPVVLIST